MVRVKVWVRVRVRVGVGVRVRDRVVPGDHLVRLRRTREPGEHRA